jgi:AcrR family transcriptional regulator/DNA-binding MarR family transcriptional regulator
MVSPRRASLAPPRGDKRDGGVRAPGSYNGAVREQLSDLQRARIIGAMFDVATLRGAGSVTVAHVVERSGVSRRTFYEQFEDCEDCLLAAFERAFTLACERVIPSYDAAKGWREQMRAGLTALLALCDEQPTVARMLICESQASGPRVNERRAEVLARLTQIVDEGRGEGKAESVSSLAAEGIVGGVLAVIQARLFEEEHTQREHTQRARGGKPLIALSNELVSMIVLPYLGAAAARRELDRPLPVPVSARRGGDTLLSDPFKNAGMRLTYRTVRVLMAIAQLGGREPGPSNRQIGETAGITDQGQISKLLGRLERIGLVMKTGIHPAKGAPNSWALTEKGQRIAQSIRTNTEGSQSHGAQER